MYYTQSLAGEINFYSQFKPESTEEVGKKILEEVKLWTKDGYFSDTQLEDAKEALMPQDGYSKT